MARTEVAAHARALELAAKANTCQACSSALHDVAAASEQRATLLGGMWDPWGDATTDGLQQPQDAADAPVDIASFVSWLEASARRDLLAATDADVVEPEEASAMVRLALGRHQDATHLAGIYGVDVTTGAANVNTTVARAKVLNDLGGGTSDGGWALADDSFAQLSPSPLEQDNQADEALASTITSWDCIAQHVPARELADETIPNGESIGDALLARSLVYLTQGATDRRLYRCQISDTSPTGLAATVLDADLALFTSSSTPVRQIGAQALLEDLAVWSPYMDEVLASRSFTLIEGE